MAGIGYVYASNGTPEEGVQRLRPLLQRLEEQGHERGLAVLYPVMARLYLTASGRYDEVLAAGDRAIALARAIGDDRLWADAALWRSEALNKLGQVDEALRAMEEAIARAEATGQLHTLGVALMSVSCQYEDRGEFEQSRRYGERAFAIAERSGDPVLRALMSTRRGMTAFYVGDWCQARVHFERAVAIDREVGLSWVSAYCLHDLGRLELAEGAWPEAARYLEEGLTIAGRSGDRFAVRELQRALAECDLLAGHAEKARGRLLPLLAGSRREDWVIPPLLARLAWVQVEVGELHEAEATVAQAIKGAQAMTYRVALVEALRVQALVFTRQHRWIAATHSLEEGLTLAERMPYPYAEARLLHVYGAMHARKGEPEPARERLEAALAIFRRLGACKDAERVEQALAMLPNVPPRDAAAQARPTLPARQQIVAGTSVGTHLSRAERQAWALEHLRTDGPLSPRAYATTLGVSVDTALRDLHELVDRGLVQAAGTTRDRRYVLAGEAVGPAIHRTAP
jgi:tetratricopeptide (TPR) repeat protein